MLWPFFPRRPHRDVKLPSSSIKSILLLARFRSVLGPRLSGVEGRDVVVADDPRMEEMEEWAQRACLRMAEVTVMHSVTTLSLIHI